MLRKFLKFNRDTASWLERKFPYYFVSPSYYAELQLRIAQDIAKFQPSSIVEVGGIDRPLLKRSKKYEYIGIDIEAQPTCAEKYDKFIVQSIEQPVNFETDMVISITLLEHVPNNSAAVTVIFNALKDEGTTHHYIPSKWHLYSIALRLVGPRMQKRLIALLRPAAVDVTGYPAFFNHCSPRAMTALFNMVGFSEVRLTCYYGACDYFAFFIPAYLVVATFENLCKFLSLELFCSGFVISAKKSTRLES